MAFELQLHDTLTRETRPFKPLKRRNVRMYVCGPTVYDFAHIGNARPVIVFDVLFRLLRHIYGEKHVTYVRNITDVDDKINARAAEEYPDLPLNVAIRKITEKTEKQFHKDVKALGCLPPSVEPRATEHIDDIKMIIERLIEHKRAYVLEDHVLFRVQGLTSYGELSHRSLEDMRSTARGEVAPKRNPMDFVLWKPSKPGEPAWPSPAGINVPGRPGWHIECSAMSWRYLGEHFDIHGGGVDLLFPHHENERAQTCRAFNNLKMARYWVHNAFLQVEGEKMAKSAGNFITINDLLRTEKFGGRSWPGGTLRFVMLQTHYRQPIDWTIRKLVEAAKELEQWAVHLSSWYQDLLNSPTLPRRQHLQLAKSKTEVSDGVLRELCNDLNTSNAITQLREYFSLGLRGDEQARFALLNDCEFLGILQRSKYYTFVGRQSWEGNAVPTHDVLSLCREIKTAISNNDEDRAQTLTASLNDLGWRASPQPDGYIGLSYIGSVVDRVDTYNRAQIESLIEARATARQKRDFKEADRIRDELASKGIVLKDSKDGTTWEIAR